ncbi:ATP-binding cassette domain-containing protein [Polaribacter sargassicola]|uniref:ATP-binding cassette domain-containing protein n=1 Tax=Polaribacter sargassicola TaxID=2836891 RepID=UPI001F0085FC|nr:ATP-binding cassette domain-containing protein [Polaribacter sp. DS7-9]MCG1036940.1 ATP-binding cassette domain-containing protein [Polaribacter sp. DS7-9]
MDNIHYVINKNSLSTNAKLVERFLKGTIDLPNLNAKKGLLFSDVILEKFIDKEQKHNTQTLTVKEKRSIRTLSSGEQKKALLNYLIAQKPDFLILESPFESLDIDSVSNLKKSLIKLSSSITIIQIFSRREEILPTATHILEVKDDKIIDNIPLKEYTFKEHKFTFKGSIPKPITFYKNISNQLISLQNVTVSYDDRCILNNINWTIHKNEFWQLIGPNGSGKTTILSMIYGNNVKAYGQEVYLFGNKKGSGESVWEIKEKIGYFSPSILELFKRKITVEQMLISGFFDSIGLYQTPTTLQKKVVKEWMFLLGLENNSFQDLSTAKQRLVLIARAMIKHPPLLILDEPLTNLDDEGTAIVAVLINKIAQESNTTILFVSHRNIKELQPDFTFELTPTKEGSLGKIKK